MKMESQVVEYEWMESSTTPSEPQIKLILLRQRDLYLIGKVTELDEEPSILIENCYEIIECAEYGQNPALLQERATSLEGRHYSTSVRKIDEGAVDRKDWYTYEYVILKRYPKFSSQRDLFLTSDTIFTILDAGPEVLDLYAKHLG